MPLRMLIAAMLSFALAGVAPAQPYPNKPIKWVIPYPPGGGVDAVGRIVGEKLSELLGVPVVVTHLPGGNGIVGTDTVRRAAADGYTLMFNASVFIMGPQVMKSVIRQGARYSAAVGRRPSVGIGVVPGARNQRTVQGVGGPPALAPQQGADGHRAAGSGVGGGDDGPHGEIGCAAVPGSGGG